jgi:hypothetical protein
VRETDSKDLVGSNLLVGHSVLNAVVKAVAFDIPEDPIETALNDGSQLLIEALSPRS